MKAITLHQPWATLLADPALPKTIETRTWPAPRRLIGERIAIHAAQTTKTIETFLEDWEDGWRFGYLEDESQIGLQNIDGQNAAALYFSGSGGLPDHTDLPFGAVIGSGWLVACIPMFDAFDVPDDAEDLMAKHGGALWIETFDGGTGDIYRDDVTPIQRYNADLPYGDFVPGNWAWIMEDIRPCDPQPAKGAQRVWNWDGAA